MAQIFWEQIRNLLPTGGEYLTGSLSVSGSFGATGSIFYNGQLLEDLIDSRVTASATDFDSLLNTPTLVSNSAQINFSEINNLPNNLISSSIQLGSDLFSGSFVAGPNITISQTDQQVIISASNLSDFDNLNNVPSGLVSSSNQILPITTSSITNFFQGIVSSSAGQSYIESNIDGNLLSFTRLNGESDSVDLGSVVPSTPTGSLVFSGSFDTAAAILTLHRKDGDITVDLASLAGGGSSTEVAGGSGLTATNDFGAGTATVSVNASTVFGTEIKNDNIAIATSSAYFIDGVLKSGLFRPTGSYYSATNDIFITGSLTLDVSGSGNQFTVLRDGNEKFKLNDNGVVVFVSQSSAPTAVAGGIYYDDDDAFYLGFQT